MTKNEIGSLINKGMSTKEIKQRIKDFPETPDIQYFEDLGYSRKTAITYISRLKKNNLKQKNQNIEKQEESEDRTVGTFIISENADENNIILDTCALNHKETIEILEKCSKVTLIYALTNDFESIEKGKNEQLKKKIRDYRKIFLKDKQKYRLVPFKWRDKRYPDELILEYIMELPAKEKPTLLTTDQNLAFRASFLGIEYILYQPPINKKGN